MGTFVFEVAASGDDGNVTKGGTTYPPPDEWAIATGENAFTVSKDLSGVGNYAIDVGLVRWDTSSLPDDAVILSATFQAIVSSKVYTDVEKYLVAEWYDAGDTINYDDWTSTVGTDAHDGVTIDSIPPAGNPFNLELMNVENINVSGYTGLRFHISGDAPLDRTVINLYSFDNIAEKPVPKLTVVTADLDAGTGARLKRGGRR